MRIPPHLIACPFNSRLSLETTEQSKKNPLWFSPSTKFSGGWSGLPQGGFFFFLRSSGSWGCGAAARRGGRRRGSLVPAHMSDEPRGAHEPWPPSRTRESPVEWAGRLWCPASRRDIPYHPIPGGEAGPARHQLRARKDGRSPALLQGAQNGGRGGPGERGG